MRTLRDDYLNAYDSLKLTRDAEGVLVAQFHSNGGPFTFTARDHTAFVDAFYRIAQDRANKIVILTEQAGSSFPVSIWRLSAMLPIPAFGARFTTKVCRCWKISPTYACRSSRLSKDAPMCTPTTRCLPA